jgi:uncharacterized protein (DUF885 family)
MRRLPLIAAISFALLSGCVEQTSTPPAPPPEVAPAVANAEQATAALDEAVNQLSLGYFLQVPESATYNGAPDALAPGANTRLNDRSVAGVAARVGEMEKRLADLKAVSTDGLSDEQRRIRETLIVMFDGALAPSRVADYGSSFDVYGVWYLPYVINQNSGPTVDIPKLMEAQQAVGNAEQARDYLARLQQIPAALDGALDKLRHDVEIGAIPPDFIVAKAKAVVDAFAASSAEQNVLYVSFVAKLGKADVAGADEFAAQALTLVDEGVLPAYRRVSSYLAEIAPLAPHDAGLWRLPNGEALYRAAIRHMTDTDLDPEAVHQIGLDEVARISAEMDTLLRAQGYVDGTVGERMAAMGSEERYVFPNTEEGKAALLASIELQMANAEALLPNYFGVFPKHPVELRVVPAFSQDSAAGGYYDPPTTDGSRPGIYWVNLRDTAGLPKFSSPTLTYHEAIPGHHMQVAIAIDQPAPFVAKSFFSNPTGEGWALYAEALAEEMGLYADDPIGDIGRLRDELHRAIRLVVDTGMHAKRWSREQAIDYMLATEGNSRGEAESEIERYVVWPGQALGYKIGMLKIQELRRDAEAAFGEDFDIRAFHDRLLAISSSALPVIESEMRAWIQSQQPSEE